MARPAPVDDGSPARLIATMVGIVGILLLGSLAWSAVGALFSAVGEAAHALSSATPAPKLRLGDLSTPSLVAVGETQTPTPTDAPPKDVTPTPTATPTSSPEPTTLTVTPTATATPGGRAPWVLLPQPAPGSRVQPGQQVIEARGRGDSAISAIRLELDGAALGVSLEQRSESVWRGSASAQVAPGHHSVRAVVVDDQGRTGSFRWAFDAGGP